ncbi:hypothetical protein ACQY0O_006409 [Thecaphora frezii]
MHYRELSILLTSSNMIDPHHIGLGLGKRKDKAKEALHRKMSDTNKVAGKQQQLAKPHVGQQRITNGPQADLPPLASNTPSTSTTKSLIQRNPEFEYFKQQTAMLKELSPRTSDFFSKRRTSISSMAPASGVSAPAPANKPGTTQKVAFKEADEFKGEPLPVRLGLAPPTRTAAGQRIGVEEYKARVGHGYYFCIPPPRNAKASGSSSSNGVRSRMNRRRDTGASEASVSSSRYSVASGSLSTSISSGMGSIHGGISPATTPESPLSLLSDWNPNGGGDGFHPSKPVATSPAPDLGRSNSLTAPSPAASVTHRSHSRAYGAASSGARDVEPWNPNDYFVTWQSRCKGKIREFKHHAFPRSKVPYWNGYDADSIEAEQCFHIASYHALNGSHVLRRFPDHLRPSRVLDVGCGAGSWCLDMALEWQQTEFIGLDVCPVQTPLAPMSQPELERRISWVVANFLETLPFPDNSFDFVHIRHLQQAIPEDRWGDVITEVERVLAPGGKVEIVEANFAFFGRVEMVDAEELYRLEHGRSLAKPKIQQPVRGASVPRPYDVDAIQIVVERMMNRRFINPSPLSVIPSMLLTQGLTDIAIGNPRHIPLRAESARLRALARSRKPASSSTSPSSSDDEEKWKEKYTNRSQIGQPLNSSFQIQDTDLFRAMVFLQTTKRISSSRELLWLEMEEDKREALRLQPSSTAAVSPTEKHDWEGQRTLTSGHAAALKPFVHPWKSKAEFYKHLDQWVDDIIHRADIEGLVEKYLGWSSGNEELTVEGRKQAERQKKLNVAASLPIGQTDEIPAAIALASSALEDDGTAERQLPLQQENATRESCCVVAATATSTANAGVDEDDDDDGTLGRASPLGFSVAASQPYHEAPGRLQTTPSSSSRQAGVANDEEQEPLDDASHGARRSDADPRNRREAPRADGKRRKSMRPTSSGGVVMGRGAGRPLGRPGMMGEANLYGNLYMAGGPARYVPLAVPGQPGLQTPSQRVAAEFAKKKAGSSGTSTRSGSSTSTDKTASSAKTAEDCSSSGRPSQEATKLATLPESQDASGERPSNEAKRAPPPLSPSNGHDLPPPHSPEPPVQPSTRRGGGARVVGTTRSVSAPTPVVGRSQPGASDTKLVGDVAATVTAATPATVPPVPQSQTLGDAASPRETNGDVGAAAAVGVGARNNKEDPTPHIRKLRARVGLMGFFDTTGYWASSV